MVEDSAADRALWRRYLSAAYECAEEEFGESGLRRCEEFSPDCVILDLNLPDLNGLDFLGRLRDKGHTCAVVVATAYGSEQIESPLASGREQPAR